MAVQQFVRLLLRRNGWLHHRSRLRRLTGVCRATGYTLCVQRQAKGSGNGNYRACGSTA